MSFLYPTFLWALVLLAVPVIIHLFYFRRFRKVYFSNVRFLREVKEETSMRSRLRNLLVLLLRCLAVAALVFAFAQPFLPVDEGVRLGRKAVSVYVDNSFSMDARGDRAAVLQLAKDRARTIIEAYGAEDRFQVVDNRLSGGSQRLVGQVEALAAVEEIVIGPESRNMAEVMAQQQSALEDGEADNRIAYLISDFQRSAAIFENPDTATAVNLVPIRAVREQNAAIDSVWLEAPVAQTGQNNLLLVRVRNYGDEDLDNVRLSITYRGQTKPEGVLSVPANDYTIDSVYLQIVGGGDQRAKLSITDFPITFDDDYFISLRATETIRVLVISEGTSIDGNLAAALQLEVFAPTTAGVRNIDYGSLGDYELVVLADLPDIASGLAEQLRQYVSGGGNLVVFPARGTDLPSYNRFLGAFPADELGAFSEVQREIGGFNDKEFVFSGVFENRNEAINLPVTEGNFSLGRYGNRGQRALLTYRDGSTALAAYPVAEGNLYLSTAPLDADLSTLSRNVEVFVPMLYKMGISSGRQSPISYTIGREETVETARRSAGGDIVYKLTGGAGEVIPQQRTVGNRVLLGLNGQLPAAGHYRLSLGTDTVESLAFNYDRLESDLDYLSAEELATVPGAEVVSADNELTLASAIRERNEGRPLWRTFIWVALACLLAEVLVIRFWRV